MTQNPQPPIARIEHKETALHGAVLTDDYAWLRDKENPEVTAYLEAENAYAEALMAPLSGLREQFYQEMLSHVKQTDVSVPYREGDWWYLTRTEEGKQYAIHCRRAGTAAGPDGRGTGAGHSGRQPARRGSRLLFHRRNRHQPTTAAGWLTPRT